jgi:hypothetical protein
MLNEKQIYFSRSWPWTDNCPLWALQEDLEGFCYPDGIFPGEVIIVYHGKLLRLDTELHHPKIFRFTSQL